MQVLLISVEIMHSVSLTDTQCEQRNNLQLNLAIVVQLLHRMKQRKEFVQLVSGIRRRAHRNQKKVTAETTIGTNAWKILNVVVYFVVQHPVLHLAYHK